MNVEMKMYNFLQANYISEKKFLVFNMMVENFIIKRKKKYLTQSFKSIAHFAYKLNNQNIEDLKGNRKVLKQENKELFKKFKALKKRLGKQKKIILSQKDDSMSKITLSFSNNEITQKSRSVIASSNVNSLMSSIISNSAFLRFYKKHRDSPQLTEESNIIALYKQFLLTVN
jgi:hypothetical protein